MAAPPKYTDEQRAAIFRLHQMGMSSTQVAAQCRLGTAGTQPFDVPRRTAQDIAKKMEAEHARASAATADSRDLVAMADRMPARVLHILDVRVGQLERKAGSSKPLTAEDIRSLAEIPKIHRAMVGSLKSSPSQPATVEQKRPAANGNVVSLVDRLQAAEAERVKAEETNEPGDLTPN